MGTITLKVPQDIHLEYQIDSLKMVEQLLEWLKLAESLKDSQENLKGKETSIPSAKAVRQWELKAQENLTRYEKTGMLPESRFDFD
jgi:hypothetical protein